MKRSFGLFAVIVLCAVCSRLYAEYTVTHGGNWPATWPKELEGLRKQARTLEGGLAPVLIYEIPFTKREEFEAAWPFILKVKSKGAPVYLRRAPETRLGRLEAGVRIHCPPAGTDRRVHAEGPIEGQGNSRERWVWTDYVELVVDGEVVDLNRIPLPADTPIVDERFER